MRTNIPYLLLAMCLASGRTIASKRMSMDIQEKGDFLMSGHFCIFNSDYSINILPTTFFDESQIKTIILLIETMRGYNIQTK